MQKILYVGNTNVFRVENLRDSQTDVLLTTATVSVTLKTEAGVAVSGQSWPVNMAAVSGEDGAYEGLLAAALALVAGNDYVAEVQVVNGGAVGLWKTRVKARIRT